MRVDWVGLPALDAKRDVSLYYWEDATWAQCATGELDSGAGALDLSPLVVSLSHTAREMQFVLRWNHELTELPQPGRIVTIRDNTTGQTLFAAQIDAVNSIVEQRGMRSCSATARVREAAPWWRVTRWNTDDYPAGTEIAVIVTDVLTAMGLTEAEINVPPFGRWVPQSSMQLGGIPAWQMLQTLLFPTACDPFVDALGRFKPISRDVVRDADVTLPDGHLLGMSGSKASPPVTSVVIKWVDRLLSRYEQQDQVLGAKTLSTGFFQFALTEKVWWSDDRMQRAASTYLKTLQDINSGLLPVANVKYDEVDEFHGRLRLSSLVWDSALVTVAFAAMLALSATPDTVTVPPGGGAAIPVMPSGRTPQMGAVGAIMLAMMSQGTGNYEVWGTPYDYVHAVNKTEAYNDAVRSEERREEEIETDWIWDEAHAQQLAIIELLYRSLAERACTVDVADDPRIEPGDVVALPSGERIYVTDYSRNLDRGSDATLSLRGFAV